MPTRVPRLEQPPHRCAFTMRGDDPEGFFLGETLAGWDPKAGIAVSYARTLARELGYSHPDDVQALRDDLAAATARAEELEALLADAQARFDAIDALESAGFRARKKPGRKAVEKDKEAVA